ncbi:MAG: hypothetical protein QOG27_1565 [Verrucomicrobiota bacterium]
MIEQMNSDAILGLDFPAWTGLPRLPLWEFS